MTLLATNIPVAQWLECPTGVGRPRGYSGFRLTGSCELGRKLTPPPQKKIKSLGLEAKPKNLLDQKEIHKIPILNFGALQVPRRN